MQFAGNIELIFGDTLPLVSYLTTLSTNKIGFVWLGDNIAAACQ
jgi:hypothetical protein